MFCFPFLFSDVQFSIAILVCGFHPVLNWKVFQSIASYDNLILKLDFVAVVSFVIDRIVCTAIFRSQEYFDRLDIFDFIFLNFCPVFFYFFLDFFLCDLLAGKFQNELFFYCRFSSRSLLRFCFFSCFSFGDFCCFFYFCNFFFYSFFYFFAFSATFLLL